MLITNVSELFSTLWQMMGLFLPFFLLLAGFQLSVTLFCGQKLWQSTHPGGNEAGFLKRLHSVNSIISGGAMSVAVAGTLYGMILIISEIGEAGDMAQSMQGVSLALTSTLGGIITARLWGENINSQLIFLLAYKYGVALDETQSEYLLKELRNLSHKIENISEKLAESPLNQQLNKRHKYNDKPQEHDKVTNNKGIRDTSSKQKPEPTLFGSASNKAKRVVEDVKPKNINQHNDA